MTDKVETRITRRRPLRPLVGAIAAGALAVPLVLMAATFWSASSKILQPPGPGDRGDLSVCRPETQAIWGADCGRFTDRTDLNKQQIAFDTQNGYALAAWKLNRLGARPADSVLLYVPGGGSDRREGSRYADLILSLGLTSWP